jgi:subtilisin
MAGASVATAAAGGLAGASEGDTVEINVGFSAESGRKAAIDAADEVVRDFNSIDAVTIRTTKAAADQLGSRADVRYTEVNGKMEALAETLPWGQDRIDSDVLHSNGELGSGGDIAIIDTGIDDDHPDLTDHLGKGKAFVECDTSGGCMFGAQKADNTCNYPWSDDNDHGTHCAGIAAGDDNTEGVVGVAPDATLHAVKVLDGCGSGSYSDVAAGIEYVADQGWDVGSLSLGGDASSTVKDAVQYAYDNGVLLVAAAGNDGPCTDCVGYPAAYQECIAVSATTPTDSLSDYSSTGPEVEIAAPGGASDGTDSTSVYSSIASNASYDYYNGTSMACPHVSGVGGQLMTNGYTNTDARSQLQDTAKDIGLASNEQGHGLVDAAAALGYDSSDN